MRMKDPITLISTPYIPQYWGILMPGDTPRPPQSPHIQRFLNLIVIVAIAALVVTVAGCSSSGDNSNVTIIVKKITLSEVSFELNNIETAFRIGNENETEVTIDEIEYRIYLGHNDKWMHIGLGQEESVDIGPGSFTDFAVTTVIEKKELSNAITDKMLGAEPTEIKVEGKACFAVGSESFEIDFNHVDEDPYSPLKEVQNSGTEGATNE